MDRRYYAKGVLTTLNAVDTGLGRRSGRDCLNPDAMEGIHLPVFWIPALEPSATALSNSHANWFAPPKMKAIPSRVRCAYLQGLTMVCTACRYAQHTLGYRTFTATRRSSGRRVCNWLHGEAFPPCRLARSSYTQHIIQSQLRQSRIFLIYFDLIHDMALG